jgi:hypothetical protein
MEVTMKKIMCLVLFVPFLAVAQCVPPYSRVPFICSDNGAGLDTLYFGFDYTATYGINQGLCEYELPPHPPTGVFDVRFVNIPGHDGQAPPAGLGEGILQDYRNWRGVDTFRVWFQPGDGGWPILFRWSVMDVLSILDSAILQDEFGGFLVKAHMNVVNTVQVTNPALSSLLLISYGQYVSVPEPDDGRPTSFGLSQNFPNPFNPATAIRYQLAARSHVMLKVFNVLGSEVATLVDEAEEPGYKSVQWDASGVSSGVYFYRLQAGTFAATRKLLLLR